MSSRDLKRYEALRELGCIACHHERGAAHILPAEVHHLVDKGYRKHSGGNQATIPLCHWHHRGEPIMNHSVTWMRGMFGPSMFHESKEFARVYGSQRELLAKVNELIKGIP
ncbi:MAG TPA: Ref family recombination enhancement nuclease [Candidatus Acidoferrales bacterium]|nr:Ref family recombination enhancement nuclease [Candidatus Acidoferrales bacterium]